jgi:hypothetical protein
MFEASVAVAIAERHFASSPSDATTPTMIRKRNYVPVDPLG